MRAPAHAPEPSIRRLAAIALVACAGVAVQCASTAPDVGGRIGNDHCAECHAQEARFVDYGAHRTVDCETCHGPGERHAAAAGEARPALRLGGSGLCLSCHGDGAASRIGSLEAHLRTLEREHRIELDRGKIDGACVYCHDPHLLE